MKRFFVSLWVSILIASLATWFFLPSSTHKGLDIWMLDVGQGESVLVKEPSGLTLLFDGGPTDEVLSQLGNVLPIWQRKIDIIVLSHPHSDHIRGLISVLKRYEVGQIWSSGSINPTADFQEWTQQIKTHAIPTKTITSGLAVSWGDTTIQSYFPLESMEGKEPPNAHDGDVVLKITYASKSILLTGDLNEEHEDALTSHCTPPDCSLASSILQIPHHGSASGLTPEFLRAVHPVLSLIPVGADNKFHHPRPEIIERLTNAHIPILRTDTDHRIHIAITEASIMAETESGQHVTLNELEQFAPP